METDQYARSQEKIVCPLANEPKVIKVYSVYYKCERVPLIHELRVETRREGAMTSMVETLGYEVVVRMRGGQEAIDEFQPKWLPAPDPPYMRETR